MRSIIIVEDDLNLAQLWKKAFQEPDHTVAVFGDGEQAINYLQSNPLPTLIISDYHMPKRNGFEVMQALNQLDPERQVRRIMVSANHLLDYAHDIEAVVDFYLVKPVSYRELQGLINRLLV